MKKFVLIVLVAILGALNANAQEVDSLSSEQMTIVDSLSMKLAKLQHDYDFLKCDYELNQLKHELSIFDNELSIKSNAVLISYYNARFDVDLYLAYRDNYNSCVALFDSLKESVRRKKLLFAVASWNFSDLENEYLNNGCDLLDKQLAHIQSSLDYYKIVIDTYKKK